tara:strand:+ start:692 stop:1315 length:624 start_codon:yes stop_codon:yes gene_type:complete
MQGSVDEEFWNWTTHFAGIILTIIGIPFLIFFNNDSTTLSTLSIIFFSFGLLLVYCSSTLYHFVAESKLKEKLRIFDHVSIYYLITGSYAPVCLITLYDYSGLTIFFTVLTFSIIGTLFKIFNKNRYEKASLLLYLFLGWLIIFDIQTLFNLIDANAKNLVILGGVFYTVGVFFYLSDSIKNNHAIWHVFVLLGSMSHYFLILFYII